MRMGKLSLYNEIKTRRNILNKFFNYNVIIGFTKNITLYKNGIYNIRCLLTAFVENITYTR